MRSRMIMGMNNGSNTVSATRLTTISSNLLDGLYIITFFGQDAYLFQYAENLEHIS